MGFKSDEMAGKESRRRIAELPSTYNGRSRNEGNCKIKRNRHINQAKKESSYSYHKNVKMDCNELMLTDKTKQSPSLTSPSKVFYFILIVTTLPRQSHYGGILSFQHIIFKFLYFIGTGPV